MFFQLQKIYYWKERDGYLYGRLIVLLFTLLLFVNISVFSSYGNSTGDQVIEKFDSGFYEKIQDKINSNLFSSQTLLSNNYYDVIFLVQKSSNNQDNKDKLENLLQEKGATQIHKAKMLSFVTASVPLDIILDLAQYDYINKIGDGQQTLGLLGHTDKRNHGVYFTNLYETKEMINANDVDHYGTGVNIAIFDNGASGTHPDLHHLITHEVVCDDNECRNNNHSSQDHGTSQVGIIAGSGLSNSQMKGISPNVGLFDLLIGTAEESNVLDLINALDYSLLHGVNVVNISLFSDICDGSSIISIIIDEAIDEGMLVVTAIGNGNGYDQTISDDSPRIPYVLNTACGTNTISVGALDAEGKIWNRTTFSDRNDYSSIGPTYDGRIKPEITTPGANVYVHDLSDDLYSWHTGTSHAAPFVSGAAGILLDAKKQLSALEIKSLLLLGAKWDPQNIIPEIFTAKKYDELQLDSSRTVSEDKIYDAINSYGFGILNVQHSLQYLENSHIIRDSIQPHHYSKDYTFTVTEQKQIKIILSWLKHPINSISNIDESFDYISDLNLELYNYDSNLIQSSVSTIQNNEFIILPSLPDGEYTIKVIPGLLSTLDNVEYFTIASTEPITPVHSNISPDAIAPTLDFRVDDFLSYPIPLSGIDDNDYLSFYVTTPPSHGILSIPIQHSNPRGTIIHYTPDDTFDGIDHFDFVAYDGKESSLPARVNLLGKNLAAGVSLIDFNPAQGDATTKMITDGSQIIPFEDSISPISAIWLDTDNPTASLFFEASPESSVYVPPNTGRLLTFDQPVLPHNVRVTVLDGHEGDSVTVSYVESQDVTINQPPTADAGNNQSVDEGTIVFLDATDSIDPEGETPLRYQWHQRSGPEVEFIGGGFQSSQVSFIAPDVTEQTILIFEVQVKDPHLAPDIDTVSIIVNDVTQQPTNISPKSKAGADQTIDEGSLIILDGRDSYDADGDSIAYSWSQTDTSGITIPLTNPDSAVVSFSAPLVEQDVILTFELTVNDGIDSTVDSVDITISDVSSSSTLPLISNPFPDDNDNFGYAVSGTNNGLILVGTPLEDLVEFPTDTSTLALADVLSKNIFSFRADSQNNVAYLADIQSQHTRFAIKSFETDIDNANDLLSLHLNANHTTNMISLADDSGNVMYAIHDIIPPEQNFAISQGHTMHHDIIAFTNTVTNSTILFDETTGLPLAQVANNAGAVYLFDDTTGSLQGAIPNPQAGSGDQFGYAISSFGDSGFVFGANQADVAATNAGAAYVYDSSTDTVPITLTAQNSESGDNFGYSVLSYDSIIIVGAPDTANGGTVTVFDGMTGTRLHTIPNPTGKSGDDFGRTITVNDNSLIIGAPFDDTISNSAGTVYLFEKTLPYSQTAQITHNNHAPFSYFGRSLAATGDVVAVGATGAINSGKTSGSVFVFSSDGSHVIDIPNPAPRDGERFGESVNLSADGKFLIIGNTRANHVNATNAGNVSVYNGTSFSHLDTIENPTPYSGDSFGNSVYITSKENSPHLFVIGSPNDQNDSQLKTGSVYVFSEYDIFEQNLTPIAFAGADLTVTERETVLLDGVGSIDPDGDDLTYFWNQTSGIQVTLNNTNQTSQRQFESPDVQLPSELIFKLIVSDGNNFSTPDYTTITVTDPTYNESPILDSISNVTLAEGVSFDVPVFSSDADGDNILITIPSVLPDFVLFTDYTNGTANVLLSPDYGDAGEYSILLQATDGRNSTLYHQTSFGIVIKDQVIPPVATDDDATTLEDVPIVIDVLSNDYDPDYEAQNNTSSSSTNYDSSGVLGEQISGIINSQGTFIAYHDTLSEISSLSSSLGIDSSDELLEITNDDVSSSDIILDIRESQEQLDSAKEILEESTQSFEKAKDETIQDLSQYREARDLYDEGTIQHSKLLEEKSEFLSSKKEYSETKQELLESKEILHEIRADLKVESHVEEILETSVPNQEKIPVYVEIIPDDPIQNVDGNIIDGIIDEIVSEIEQDVDITTQHENILVTTVSQSELEELADSEHVISIEIPHMPELFTVSQGVALSHANLLHDDSITGENVTVAVIDDSFILSDDSISGTISYSALFDSAGYCNGLISCGKTYDNSHGTAVAGIISDMAPDVSLEVYAITNSIDFVNTISHIIQRGEADVISISLGFPTLGGDGTTGNFRDGTSHVAKAVDLAKSAGIIVISASGNDGQRHWNGQYTPSSTVSPDSIGLSGYQSVMEFAPEKTGTQKACLPISHSSLTLMSWDSWYVTNQNYDLFLYDDTMNNILRDSRSNQNEIPGTPLERIYGGAVPSACLVIASYDSTENHNFHVYSIGGQILDESLLVSENSISTPADAASTISVGAINYSTDTLESFSSRGPTDDGRDKPEICGYNRVSTSQGVFSPFVGTSSAAPHVAGATALLISAYPSYDSYDIENILLQKADITNEVYSAQNLCGSGIVSLQNILPLDNNDTPDNNTNQTGIPQAFENVYDLSIESIEQSPQNGHVTITENQNAIVYYPDPNYFGNDFFEYTVRDVDGLHSGMATVSIEVQPINDPPILNEISDISVTEGTTKDVTISATDVDGTQGIIFTSNGTLQSFASINNIANANAVITLSPSVSDSGLYSITILVTDSGVPEPLSDVQSFSITIHDADLTLPVIDIIGDSHVTVNLGEMYTDSGAIATDNIDGGITDSIIIQNPVNTLLPGVYTITYTIIDSSGNQSQITRKVTVTNTASSISTIYGDGSDGNLEVLDTVTLSGKKQYTNVIVRNNGIITVPQGEILDIRVNGTILFEPGGIIDVDGKGSSGGAGGHSIPGAGGKGGTSLVYSSYSCFQTPIGCWPHYGGFPGDNPSGGTGSIGDYGGVEKSAGNGGSSSNHAGGISPAIYPDVPSFVDVPSFIQTHDKLIGGAAGSGGGGAQSGTGEQGGAGGWVSYRDHGIRSGTTGSAGAQSAIGGDGGNGGGTVSVMSNILYGDIHITANGNNGKSGESSRGASSHGAGGGGAGSGGIVALVYSKILQPTSGSNLVTSSLGFDDIDVINSENNNSNYDDGSSYTLADSASVVTIEVSAGIAGDGGDGNVVAGGTDGNKGGPGFDGVIFTQQITGLDSARPQISLIGDDVIDVRFGSVYEDLGATVTDNDVSYSGTIHVDSSDVTTGILGEYTVYYTATPDSQGNIPHTITRTVNVIPNPIFGYGTDGSFDIIGDVTISPGIYNYENLTIHDNSNLITNGKTIIFVNDTYSEIGSGHITVNPTGCSGGNGGTTQNGAGGAGGGFVISSNGRYGLPGSPGQLPTITPPQLASQCTILSDASILVDTMDVSDTFTESFMNLQGGQGSDGTDAASSGSGGTGGSGYYYTFSGPDRYGSGQTGGAGGTGSQGSQGVFGGGTFGIFVKNIESDSITISATGNDGNDGDQGTADPGEPGRPARQSSVRGNIYWIPASYPGSGASGSGTTGSDGSQGGIVYLGYGSITSDFTANIDVSGGMGGSGGSHANGSPSSQIGITGSDGYFFVQKVADTFPPIMALNGDSSIITEYGDSYVDSGATAIDDTDGDITNLILVDNPVNATQVGTYDVTYTITDSAGNSATLSRIVNVVDTTPPVITISGVTQIVAEYGGYTEDEDYINNFSLQSAPLLVNSVNSTESNSTGQDNAPQPMIITAYDPVDGSVEIIIHDDDVNLFQIGTHTITYTAQDKHGNQATPVTSTVMVQDTIAPSISLVGGHSIKTDYGDTFEDPGIIAVDPVDGDLTPQVIITKLDNINTGIMANYTITYSISDSHGNSANVTRIIEVYEKTLSAMQSLPYNYTTIESDGTTNNGTTIGLPKTIVFDDLNLKEALFNGTSNNEVTGANIMGLLSIPEYDLTKKYNPSSLSTITINHGTTQYSMTPPVEKWIANQKIMMQIDSQTIPEFGGVFLVVVHPSDMVDSSESEWLMIQADSDIPELYGVPTIPHQDIQYDMFVDVKYPHDEGMTNATDWSDGVNHNEKPTISMMVPKPNSNSMVDTTSDGCMVVEPLYYDESISQWIAGHARILSNVPSDSVAEFCEVIMEVDHFSSFALVGTSSTPTSSSSGGGSTGGSSSSSSSTGNGRSSSSGSHGSPTSSEAIARLQEIKDNITLENGADDPYTISVESDVLKSVTSESYVFDNDQNLSDGIFTIESLKQQIANGISYDQIVCNDSLELIFKMTDNSLACVKHETKSKLIERGWAL